jgi:hypothetical protein
MRDSTLELFTTRRLFWFMCLSPIAASSSWRESFLTRRFDMVSMLYTINFKFSTVLLNFLTIGVCGRCERQNNGLLEFYTRPTGVISLSSKFPYVFYLVRLRVKFHPHDVLNFFLIISLLFTLSLSSIPKTPFSFDLSPFTFHLCRLPSASDNSLLRRCCPRLHRARLLQITG